MNQKFFPWKPLILSGAFLTALTACSSGEGALDLLPETDAVEIRLSGDIGSLTGSADTRKPIDETYTSPLTVSFARVDQDVSTGDYPAYSTVTAPLQATRAGGSGQTVINFSTTQYYLTRETNNNTRLVGWYPSGSYASGTVTFNISLGATDVMLTQELTGDKKSQFGSAKSFTFNHLLTKVTVKAYGDASVNDTWGVIRSVKVKKRASGCIVALPGSVTWDGNVHVILKNLVNDQELGDVSLVGKTTDTNTADCGYAMFQPTTDNKLILIVNTEKGGEREVEVSLASGSTFAAGKAYTITLQFKSTIISPTATISAWEAGDDKDVDL